jgi:hypothetical protein
MTIKKVFYNVASSLKSEDSYQAVSDAENVTEADAEVADIVGNVHPDDVASPDNASQHIDADDGASQVPMFLKNFLRHW